MKELVNWKDILGWALAIIGIIGGLVFWRWITKCWNWLIWRWVKICWSRFISILPYNKLCKKIAELENTLSSNVGQHENDEPYVICELGDKRVFKLKYPRNKTEEKTCFCPNCYFDNKISLLQGDRPSLVTWYITYTCSRADVCKFNVTVKPW